jgi:hypothetical protein
MAGKFIYLTIGIVCVASILLLAGCAQRVIRTNTTIEFGPHIITKNFWGAPPEENLSGSIYYNQDKTFGWSWDRQNPLTKPGVNGILPIFPNVRIGADLGQASNSKLFPLKASSVNRLLFNTTYLYLDAPTGEYNLAYQIYYSDSSKPAQANVPRAEVMIWIHHTFGQPPHTLQGDYSDGNTLYQLYSWTMPDGRIYYCFLTQAPPSFSDQHIVDAKKLLDTLPINPQWYLLGVSLGNEVLNGTGNLEILQLSVNLNGKLIQ